MPRSGRGRVRSAARAAKARSAKARSAARARVDSGALKPAVARVATPLTSKVGRFAKASGKVRARAPDVLSLLERLHRDQGPRARLRLGVRDIFLFTDPDDVHDVLVAKNASFKGLELARPLLDDGILSVNGAQHRRHRKMLQPAFHHRRIATFGAIAAEAGARAGAAWKDGQRLDMAEEMMRVTLEATGQILLGRDHSADVAELGEVLTAALETFRESPFAPWTTGRMPTPHGVRFARRRAKLDAMVKGLLTRRRARPEPRDDLLAMLLETRWEDGEALSDKEVRDELLTLLVAGHETTALALTWAWHCLAQHPRAQERLQKEVEGVLQGRDPTVEDVPRLAYTRQVLAEAMRLYPPVWAIGRQATEPVEVGGMPIRRGSYAVLSPYLTHRDPALWPEPERFDPDRFLPGVERPKLAYFPFGTGPRVCIGEQLAWMEGILILAAIAQRWSVQPADDAVVRRHPLLTLQPRGGLPLRVTQRA